MIGSSPSELARAREVIARPDIHSIEVLNEACSELIAHGDWMDHERARELRRALEREACAPPGPVTGFTPVATAFVLLLALLSVALGFVLSFFVL